MEINNLSTFVYLAKSKKKRLVVAAAADLNVLEAVYNASKDNIIEPILVGNITEIHKLCSIINFDVSGITIIDEKDPIKASLKSVSIIREGGAELLMKGLVSTGGLLKAVLDKENGLRMGNTISHVAIFQSEYYHKLLCITDAAMNIAPDFDVKVDILNNAVDAFKKIGIHNPKVAVIAAVETVNIKMEATVHAALLTQMNKRGQITGCIVDGPLGLDNAVSKEAAEHKGIKSEVAGDSDILLAHDINSANILYKTLSFLGGATAAAVIMGAKVPIVLTSRADSEKSKLYSIALAAAMD